MDLATIKQEFAAELDLLRTRAHKARKYSPQLKRAILALCRSGESVDKIRIELGLDGQAFKNWLANERRQNPPATSHDFVPIKVTPVSAVAPVKATPTQIVIELPSGTVIRVH
jgi:transposase-like protein